MKPKAVKQKYFVQYMGIVYLREHLQSIVTPLLLQRVVEITVTLFLMHCDELLAFVIFYIPT